MKCPICEVDLQMTERQGVEIDYCPKCRGIWLDRGELDKIIEKSESVNATLTSYQEPLRPKQGYDDRHNQNEYHFKKKHKREGLLGDLFDF